MPTIAGDEGFTPVEEAADLIILIASDDMYANEYVFGRIFYGGVHPGIAVRRLERGYSRPDSREPSGFEDGISNPRNLPPDYPMQGFVYVRGDDDEPAWCVDGTYLAYRKIRRRLAAFFKLDDEDRAQVFGVDARTGTRTPGAAACSHSQKINPHRNHPDLFGMSDEERRFLRRPYFFDDGLDARGEEVRGLHHLSFVRRLTDQYEWPVQMWQTNPDFPHPGAGADALYGVGGAANIGGGYYFIPPAPAQGGFYGDGLLR
jgi:deferrochelatase/peroxidase EfeB